MIKICIKDWPEWPHRHLIFNDNMITHNAYVLEEDITESDYTLCPFSVFSDVIFANKFKQYRRTHEYVLASLLDIKI